MSERLDGKTVAVFGGSSGIGFATAMLALERGAAVTIISRKPSRLADASMRVIEAQHKWRFMPLQSQILDRSAPIHDRCA